MPSCSDPAIGWPPTNRAAASGRAASTAATTGPFTEPTSVTTRAPASSACDRDVDDLADRHRDDRDVGIARRVLDRSRDLGDRAERPWPARRVRCRGRSRRLGDPRRASARPTDPPMRPVPITATRTVSRYSGRSSRSDRAPSRYTWWSAWSLLLAVEVHEHADAAAACRARCRARAHRSTGTSPRPERPRRRRGELGGEIVGRGEDDADESSCVIAVAVEHLLHEALASSRRSRPSCPRRRWSRPAGPASHGRRG